MNLLLALFFDFEDSLLVKKSAEKTFSWFLITLTFYFDITWRIFLREKFNILSFLITFGEKILIFRNYELSWFFRRTFLKIEIDKVLFLCWWNKIMNLLFLILIWFYFKFFFGLTFFHERFILIVTFRVKELDLWILCLDFLIIMGPHLSFPTFWFFTFTYFFLFDNFR